MSSLNNNLYTGFAIIISLGIFLYLLYKTFNYTRQGQKIQRKQHNNKLTDVLTLFNISWVAVIGFALICISSFLDNSEYTSIIAIIYIIIYLIILSSFINFGNVSKININGIGQQIRSVAGIIKDDAKQLLNAKLIGGLILFIASIVIFSLVNSDVLK